MKKRTPRTFEHAITKISGELTDEGAAEAIGKSASMVRKWGDPDCDCLPNLQQAAKLDLAYLAQGGGYAPILEVYAKHIEAAGLSPECTDIIGATFSMVTTMGQLTAAVQSAKAPTGPGGHRVTKEEKSAIRGAIDRVQRNLAEIESALKSPQLKEVS